MDVESTVITLHAKELIASHGSEAEIVAEERMFYEMQQGDVKAAGLWLAVASEIRHMQLVSGAVN